MLLAGVVLTLLAHWFPPADRSQLLFMVFTFILFGIPHGALDLYIEGGWDQETDKRKFFFRYIIYAALYIGLWFLNPGLALLVFILITAFHFGDIDWMGKREGAINSILCFLMGFCWILFLLSLHVNEALGVFDSITRHRIDKDEFLKWGAMIYPAALAGMLLLLATFFFFKRRFFVNPSIWYAAAAQQLLLIILAYYTPLWIFFAFYFGIWHSLLSLDKIRIHFNMEADWRSWMRLLQKAMPFTVLAFIGILYFIFLTVKSDDPTGMLSLVFIALAVLTLPHLQVFAKLNKKV